MGLARQRRSAVALLAVALAALALAGCGGDGRDGQRTTGRSGASSGATPAPGGTLAAVPDLVRDVQPGVVSVLVRGSRGAGEGSGIVWRRRVVVTNHHVVAGAEDVTIALASGVRISARVRASDPRTDVALLDVDRDLPPVTFSDRLPTLGELAVALGAPLGFENTVTAGIVSGLDRSIPSGGRTPALVGLILTDAAISPGNSGGAHDAVVAAVEEGGPAADGGLRPGDVVVRAGDRNVRSVEDVLSALRGREPGERLRIEVVRGDERRTLDVELGRRPS